MLASQGLTNSEIAHRVGVTRLTVISRRTRYEIDGLDDAAPPVHQRPERPLPTRSCGPRPPTRSSRMRTVQRTQPRTARSLLIKTFWAACWRRTCSVLDRIGGQQERATDWRRHAGATIEGTLSAIHRRREAWSRMVFLVQACGEARRWSERALPGRRTPEVHRGKYTPSWCLPRLLASTKEARGRQRTTTCCPPSLICGNGARRVMSRQVHLVRQRTAVGGARSCEGR